MYLCHLIVYFRFRGELFGLGTNHTKYKSSKQYGGGGGAGSSSMSSGMSGHSSGGLTNSLSMTGQMQSQAQAQAQAMHYGAASSASMHYGGNGMLHHSNSGYALYDDSQHLGEGY